MTRKNAFKTFINRVFIIFLISVTSIFLYKLYDEIEVGIENDNIENTNVETTRVAYNNGQDEETDISEVIENVSSCIVGISKENKKSDSIFLNNDATSSTIGTGMIVSKKGYILTNNHVCGDKNSKCYVTLENGKEYIGNVIWSDSDIDLAIVKVDTVFLKTFELGDSENIKVGQEVYAIGNPIGFEFKRTVTYGIISAVDRTIKIENEDKTYSYMSELIQTDATINPGNSGGPLINSEGKVIGINTVKITTAEGIGFAVPINIVKPIIEKLNNNEEFEEAKIGIFAYDNSILPYLDDDMELESGIYVAQIEIDGAAARSGIKVGDIITKVDDIEISKMSQLRMYIYKKNPNNKITLTILRNNKERKIDITLVNK